MVNIYESMLNDLGHQVKGRTKLFIIDTDKDGSIGNYLSGTACVPESNGTMFIVDDFIIGQVRKLKFIDGQLSIKEGETIEKTVKSEIELQEEELLRQLEELRAQKSESAE